MNEESSTVPKEPPPENQRSQGRLDRLPQPGNALASLMALAALALPWSHLDPAPAAGTMPSTNGAEREQARPERPNLAAEDDPKQQRGWVVTDDGAPAAGVRVVIAGDRGSELELLTDAGGAFGTADLQPGSYAVRLSGENIFDAHTQWIVPGKPVRILVTRKVEISGVVMRDGEVVAGAHVAVTDGSRPRLLETTTGAKGGYHFGPLVAGRYRVWSWKHDGASAPLMVDRSGPGPYGEASLQLLAASRLRGRVTDAATGEGIDAGVLLVSRAANAASRLGRADADGRFALDGVPLGDWTLELHAPGYVAGKRFAVTAKAGTVTIETTLGRGGTVQGQVVDARGKPVAGVSLIVRSATKKRRANDASYVSYSAIASASRARRFTQGAANAAVARSASDGAIGSLGVRWTHPLAAPREMPTVAGRQFGAFRGGVRPEECGRGHCGVDLGHDRGTVIHAAGDGIVYSVVREPRGRAGRFVSIDHAGGIRTYSMHMDRVRVDLQAGQRVRAGDPLGTIGISGLLHPEAPHLHFAMAQTYSGRRWFMDPTAVLRHAVLLNEPEILDGVAPVVGDAVRQLVATSFVEPTKQEKPAATAVRAHQFTTDVDGKFSIDGIAPGKYTALATHPVLTDGVSKKFVVRTAMVTKGVRIRLSAGVVVHGVVLDDHGNPVENARVVAEENAGTATRELTAASTDTRGLYELRPLQGAVSLRITAPNRGGALRTVKLRNMKPAVRRQEENFRLTATDSRVFGRVRDPDGFAARGVRLNIIHGPAGRGRTTITDDNGDFSIPALPEGDYALRASSDGYPQLDAQVKAGQRATLSLPQGGGIELEMRDAHTRVPLERVTLEARGPGERRRSLVALAGAATLVPLVPGEWQLIAKAKGYIPARRTFRVTAGRGPKAITSRGIRMELKRGAQVGGIVRNHNGDRAVGARVSVGELATTTDQDGAFKLADVPTGSIALLATLANEKGVEKLELAPGDELTTVQIDMQLPE